MRVIRASLAEKPSPDSLSRRLRAGNAVQKPQALRRVQGFRGNDWKLRCSGNCDDECALEGDMKDPRPSPAGYPAFDNVFSWFRRVEK